QRRVPKFGFTNINRKEYAGVNIDVLQAYVDEGRLSDVITIENLIEERLVDKNDLVKILGRGELKATINISAHKFTATAKAAIEKAGGQAQTL
ncbi:uL15m family ribosomal protein, partial [Nonlabens ulvanivorans]